MFSTSEIICAVERAKARDASGTCSIESLFHDLGIPYSPNPCNTLSYKELRRKHIINFEIGLSELQARFPGGVWYTKMTKAENEVAGCTVIGDHPDGLGLFIMCGEVLVWAEWLV